MIFRTEIREDKYIIIALPESDSERHGYMLEGNFRPIHLVGEEIKLEFGYIPKVTHPDVIALIAFCAFYPYLTSSKKVTFPDPISVKAKEEFEKFFTFSASGGKKEDHPPIAVENYSETQAPYAGTDEALIAFGGGMDSTSLSLLFPEYLVVNQVDDIENRPVMQDYYAELHAMDQNFKGISEYTNIRSLNKPYGYSGWVCCFLLPLLVAADKGFNSVLSGGIFGSSYMSGSGKKFNKEVLKYNAPFKSQAKIWNHRSWLYLFKELGIFQYSPVAGMTELLSSRIIYDYKISDKVLYCQQKDGKPCHNCPKCFRKNLELEFWEYVNTGNIRSQEYWEQYINPRTLNRYKDDYQYFGHIMNFLSQSVPNSNKPEWFKENAIYCNANTAWVTKLYTKSLMRIPDQFREYTEKRLRERLPFMDDIEMFLAEQYDGSDYAFSNFNLHKKN